MDVRRDGDGGGDGDGLGEMVLVTWVCGRAAWLALWFVLLASGFVRVAAWSWWCGGVLF